MAKIEIPAQIQQIVSDTGLVKSSIKGYVNSSKYGSKYLRILAELCQFSQVDSPTFRHFWGGLSAKERFVIGKICFDFVRDHQSFGFPEIETILKEALAHHTLHQSDQCARKAVLALELISEKEAYEWVPMVAKLINDASAVRMLDNSTVHRFETLKTDFAGWVAICQIWDVYGKCIVQAKVETGIIDFGKIDELAAQIGAFSYHGNSLRVCVQLLNARIFIALAKGNVEEAVQYNLTLLHILEQADFVTFHYPDLAPNVHYRLVSSYCELNQKNPAISHSLELRKIALGRDTEIMAMYILSELYIAEAFLEAKNLSLAEKAWQGFCAQNPAQNASVWYINVLFHLIRCKLILHQPHKIQKLLLALSQLPKESLKPEFQVYGRIFEMIIAWDQGDIENVKRLTKSFKAFFKRMEKGEQFPQVGVILRFFTSLRSNTTPAYEAIRAREARMELQNLIPMMEAEIRVLDFRAVLEKRFDALKAIQNGNNA